MTSLRDLLERVERATGPDRELDAAICEVLHSSVCEPEYRGTHHGEPVWRHPDFGLIRCETYTASVDVALALIGRVQPDAEFELCYRRGALRCVKWWSPARNVWIIYEKPLAIVCALLAAMIEQEGINTADTPTT